MASRVSRVTESSVERGWCCPAPAPSPAPPNSVTCWRQEARKTQGYESGRVRVCVCATVHRASISTSANWRKLRCSDVAAMCEDARLKRENYRTATQEIRRAGRMRATRGSCLQINQFFFFAPKKKPKCRRQLASRRLVFTFIVDVILARHVALQSAS